MTAVQMSDTQFEQLIKTIKELAPEPEKQKSKGSFTNCTVRFAGQHDHDAVEEFITAIEAYKDMEQISDEDALKGISLLFVRDAITWWKGVRRQVQTWKEAMTMLRDHFSPTKAPHEIYLEIFETRQGHNEPIDTFICKQRALLAKLPERLHSEETELNFVYGLLAQKYKQHIPRHDLKTFRDLLGRGRAMERNRKL